MLEAAKRGDSDLFREHLETWKNHGYSLGDVKDSVGTTPLSAAVSGQRFAMVRLLHEIFKVDLNSIDKKSKTPLDIAIECKYDEIRNYLAVAGAATAQALKDAKNKPTWSQPVNPRRPTVSQAQQQTAAASSSEEQPAATGSSSDGSRIGKSRIDQSIASTIAQRTGNKK
jgi:ankyrin repeat protein